jgi:hypothetical protein
MKLSTKGWSCPVFAMLRRGKAGKERTLLPFNRKRRGILGGICLRISDQGISITVGKVCEDIDLLNKVYRAVIDILLSINNKFIELPK